MGRFKGKQEREDKKVNRNRDKFILLGNTRIKIGNIKDYGISSEWIEYEKIYKVKEEFLGFGFIDRKLVWDGQDIKELSPASICDMHFRNLFKRYRNKDDRIVSSTEKVSFDDLVVTIQRKYLYISTFQKDNFRFYEHKVDFDIKKKCAELDKLLCL